MSLRIAAIVVLLIAVSALPLYISIPLGILALIKFKNFYELVPIFFVHDALYGVPQDRFFGFPYIMTLMAIVAVLISVWARTQVFESRGRITPY